MERNIFFVNFINYFPAKETLMKQPAHLVIDYLRACTWPLRDIWEREENKWVVLIKLILIVGMNYFMTPSGMVSWKKCEAVTEKAWDIGKWSKHCPLCCPLVLYRQSYLKNKLDISSVIKLEKIFTLRFSDVKFCSLLHTQNTIHDLCSQDKIMTTFNKCTVTPETDSSQVHEKVHQETENPPQISITDKASIWLLFSRTVLTLNNWLDSIPLNPSSVLEIPIFHQIVTELSQ